MNVILSVVMLAALALLAGGIYLLRRGGARRQGWLMLLLALVMIGNVLIWTVPDGTGAAPIDRAERR